MNEHDGTIKLSNAMSFIYETGTLNKIRMQVLLFSLLLLVILKLPYLLNNYLTNEILIN